MPQTTQQPVQQPVIPQPPKVITTKDNLYLRDAMSWLLVSIKKCNHFANECQDADVQQAINKVGQTHQRHYELLLKHLQNNNTAEMTKIQQMMQ